MILIQHRTRIRDLSLRRAERLPFQIVSEWPKARSYQDLKFQPLSRAIRSTYRIAWRFDKAQQLPAPSFPSSIADKWLWAIPMSLATSACFSVKPA